MYDMTLYLYKAEIDEAYEDTLSKLTAGSVLDTTKFYENKVGYYITKIGYLDIVSEFIARKGYQEAISAYIEEKTPKIIRSGKSRFLVNSITGVENRVVLTDAMLALHRSLLYLPWNNIYTTNYDEMLEEAYDATTMKIIEKEIRVIQAEIENLLEEQKAATEEIGRKSIIKRLEDKERDYSLLLSALTECLSVVTDSSQLGLKRNKNIIKLHGTIRKKEDAYGFDGDNRKQYVIAREDYESYPAKHEAFTQLMRISLLQESYCLIGFSGVDTNFIGWIKWVRDIVERGKGAKPTADYKIYFIDVSLNPNPLDADKELFFENHRVLQLQIMEGAIIDFLEAETSTVVVDRNAPREVLGLFFKYLAKSTPISLPNAAIEVIHQNKYRKLWDKLDLLPTSKADVKDIFKIVKDIAKLKSHNRIPSVHFAYANNKIKLLAWAGVFIEGAAQDEAVLKDVLKSIFIALSDTFLTFRFSLEKATEDSIYANLPDDRELRLCFDFFKLRECTLAVNRTSFESLHEAIRAKLINGGEDALTYESILYSAFSFDFRTLKEQLSDWRPTSHWLLKKAGLLSFFQEEAAILLVNEYINNVRYEHPQEHLYALELLQYLEQNHHYGFNKVLSNHISQFKNLDLKGVKENLESIIKDVSEAPKKLEHYGKNRLRVTTQNISLSNDFTAPQKGLQYLQLLLESGLPASLSNVHLKNPEAWYKVQQLIFEHYPFPSLFFTLQYSNREILRRIGQDYAYSDHLQDDNAIILPLLLEKLLQKETPAQYKRSMVSFMASLFIAVDPPLWEDNLLEVVKDKDFRRSLFANRHLPEVELLMEALPFIKSRDVLRFILKEILNHHSGHDQSISYTYGLSQNPIFEQEGQSLQDAELADHLNRLIQDLGTEKNAWFLIGNLTPMLTSDQKESVVKKIQTINTDTITTERIWKIFLVFGEQDPRIKNKIKKSILDSVRLWDAGFTAKGLSSQHSFIRLINLEKTPYSPNGISWSKKEAEEIFNKLVAEVHKIENWLSTKGGLHFQSILEEMKYFLERQEPLLHTVHNFTSLKVKINQLYEQHKGYGTVTEGIISPDRSQVVWALGELDKIMHEDFREAELPLDILLNKVLLQSGEGLEESLYFLAVWLQESSLKTGLTPFIPKMILILRQYLTHELSEHEKPFVQEQLIMIADTLKDWGAASPHIDKWLKVKKSSYFNNIKNLKTIN